MRNDQLKLFKEQSNHKAVPLAEKARPENPDQIVGQEELLAEGSILSRMLETGKYASFIMWGPPGSGKTTIARVIHRRAGGPFESLSAVLSGVRDVRNVMQQAEVSLETTGKPTILFIDEIHRFNKAQQDAFLPYVENGAIILIGATTENPSFEVIPALLSRCHVLVLKPLSDEHLAEIIDRALQQTGKTDIIPTEVRRHLISISRGDARKALNYTEILLNHSKDDEPLTLESANNILTRSVMVFDKKGEEFYNLISALHKSCRSSDPQAGLYWLARMLEAGVDPMYVARRLVRFASEDVGLADPQALVQANAAKDAVHFLGMPEASTALAQAVVYLATSPKSNALYAAYKTAAEDAHRTDHLGVPMHIRNAPTGLMKDLGYGKEYRYDHESEHSFSGQDCFPESLEKQEYYVPGKYGFEREVRKRLDWWNSLRNKQKGEHE